MRREDPSERFWRKVAYTPSCWLYTGFRGGNGYGRFWNDRTVLAHRFAYEDAVGPIPAGLTIDHLCRNHACVNPSHLEAVTSQTNSQRGLSWNRAKTHCPHGHPLDGKKTVGARYCKTCNRAREAARRERKKALLSL